MDIYEKRNQDGLIAEARQYAIPEAEVLQAWEEMRKKYRLPFYVESTLETSLIDGTIVLTPAVDINLLSRLQREVPDFESIPRPRWPAKTVPESAAEWVALLAKVETNPIRKFCCRECDECAPTELLEESRLLDRLSWLRTHVEAKHPVRLAPPPPIGKRIDEFWPDRLKG